MKKIFIAALSVFMMTTVISCDNKSKNNDPAESDKLAYETITVEEGGDSLRMRFRFVVDFPIQGPEALVNEIKKNIFYSMGDSALTDMSEKNLNTIGKKYLDLYEEEVKEMQDSYDGNYAVSYANEGQVKIIENTDKYVTYNTDSYNYTGGAHGMPYNAYFTIDKSNNKTLTLKDVIAADKMDAFKEMLKGYIVAQYYEGETPAWDDVFKFDLPTQAPAITANGIIFNYAAYEIDCYAAGMPKCKIPYEDIEEMMTEEAKTLIK